VPGVTLVSAAEPGREPAAAQEQSAIKFNNYARRVGDRYERPYYEWRVFVDEQRPVLDTIAQVDYVLHPTFPEPFQTSTDRDKKFEISASGWGGFAILITVRYTNGKEAKTSYQLDLTKNWPVEAQPATVSPMQLKLEKIQVKSDGSVGSTGWTFDILLDGKRLSTLPKRNYDDGTERTKRANEIVPEANRRVVGSLKVAKSQMVRLEVRGRRTVGSDTATGQATFGASAGPVVVSVTNKRNPKNGSFVFHFAAVPM
jgi:transcription initiation factor IIF auxiliary subunit